jgi:hypothetical protein
MVILLATSILLYWSFWPYEVVKYNSTPAPVLQSVPGDVAKFNPNDKRDMAVFKRGERILILHDYCRIIDAPVEIDLELIDSVKFSIPYASAQSNVGCQKRVSANIRAPDFFYSKEPVKLHFTLRYKVNPIRTVTYHLETEYFKIEE